MEYSYRNILSALIAAAASAGCAVSPTPSPTALAAGNIEAVKELVKTRVPAGLYDVCNAYITRLPEAGATQHDLLVSFASAVGLLHSCRCLSIEQRNALCEATSPGCDPIKSCGD